MKLVLQYQNKQNGILRPKVYCENCGIHSLVCGPHNLEYHRIIKNGPYVNENVKILCDKCHKLVHKLTITD
jgi:hypothetical protein